MTVALDLDRPTAPDHAPLGGVVIDVTDGAPPPPPKVTGRWSPRWIVTALVGVAVVAVVAVAAANYSAALQWRDRALSAERRAAQAVADAASSRAAAASARHERRIAVQRRRAIAEQLVVSEADVAALEARVFALASDRARREDLGGLVVTPTSADLLHSLRAQVDSCVAQVRAARIALTGAADVSAWRQALSAAQAACEQVAADVETVTEATR